MCQNKTNKKKTRPDKNNNKWNEKKLHEWIMWVDINIRGRMIYGKYHGNKWIVDSGQLTTSIYSSTCSIEWQCEYNKTTKFSFLQFKQ